MQAYSPAFARVYNLKWPRFAHSIAPYLLDFYGNFPTRQRQLPILDLCCGTGQLATHFLEKGYSVVGIDLSEPMLAYARENNQQFLQTGQVSFIQADASDFTLPQQFGLVVSTYDALNHLASEADLYKCFDCVSKVNSDAFVFDLNTRTGLAHWNNISVEEFDDIVLITRGLFDPSNPRAWTNISGFILESDGKYSRFSESVFSLVLEMEKVRQALLSAGWRQVHFAKIQDINTPLSDPEKEPRVFVVARK